MLRKSLIYKRERIENIKKKKVSWLHHFFLLVTTIGCDNNTLKLPNKYENKTVIQVLDEYLCMDFKKEKKKGNKSLFLFLKVLFSLNHLLSDFSESHSIILTNVMGYYNQFTQSV